MGGRTVCITVLANIRHMNMMRIPVYQQQWIINITPTYTCSSCVLTQDQLDDGERPPGHAVIPIAPGIARLHFYEICLIIAIVEHVPSREDLAHNNGDESNSVFKTGAIVDRLRVPVNHQQT